VNPNLVLWIGLGAVALVPLVAGVAFLGQNRERAGVSRSIAALERGYAAAFEVARQRSLGERIGRPLLRRLGNVGHMITPSGAVSGLQRRLDYAGNPTDWPVERVVAAKGVGLVAGAALGGAFAFLLGYGPAGVLLACIAGGAAGFFLPDMMIYNNGVKRQDEIQLSLPDVLDTLTIAVEAGQGFDAALAQVSRNGRGPMVGETARVLQEMRIGKSRTEALRSMSARTTVAELKGFASAVVQASDLGVPVGNVLREQAREMRVRRRQRAEEQAQKVPIKILFPTLFCLFPALFVVVIGPGVLNVMNSFVH
jgi:tight adherence protein C